jgi:hypothetical protein
VVAWSLVSADVLNQQTVPENPVCWLTEQQRLILETFSETVNRPQKHDDRGRATIYLVAFLKRGSATPRLIGNVDN